MLRQTIEILTVKKRLRIIHLVHKYSVPEQDGCEPLQYPLDPLIRQVRLEYPASP